MVSLASWEQNFGERDRAVEGDPQKGREAEMEIGRRRDGRGGEREIFLWDRM